MLQVLILAVGGLFGLWFICRCLAWLICWVVKRLCEVDLTIGKVGFFTFGQVSINLHNGISLEIERLWLSSSFINNEISKPVAICIGGTRIQLELPKNQPTERQEIRSPRKGLPPLLGYLQFLGFVIDNAHVIMVRGSLPGCLAQLTVQEAACDWTIDYTRANTCLDLLLKVSGATARLLLDGATTPCIAEVSLSSGFYFRVETSTAKVQVARVTVEKPSVWITEGLLKLLGEIKSSQAARTREPLVSDEGRRRQQQKPRGNPEDILKYIPDEVYMQLEGSKVALFKEPAHRKLGFQIQDILLRFNKPTAGGASAPPAMLLTVKDVTAGSAQVKVASLTELTSTLKIEDQAINIRTKILCGFFGYHQEEFQYWSSMIPKRKAHGDAGAPPAPPSPSLSPLSPTPPQDSRGFFSQLIGQRMVSVSTEVERGTLSLATASCTGLKGGLDEARMTVSFKLDHRGEGADIRCETELMGLSCMLADVRQRNDDLTSKQHRWGTILYLGILITKIRCLSDDITIDSMLDSIQVEWSTSLCNVLMQIINAVHRGRNRSDSQEVADGPPRSRSSSQRQSSGSRSVSRINLQCSSINGFLWSELNVGTMVRIDSLVLQHRGRESSGKLDGTKLVYFTREGQNYPLVRCHEIHAYDGHLKHVNVHLNNGMPKVNVDVAEEVYFVWKTSLHLCVFTAVSEIMDIVSVFKGHGDAVQTPASPQTTPRSSPSSLQVSLAVRANCMVALQLSTIHKLSINVQEIKLDVKPGKTTLTVPHVSISCDQHEIFTVEVLSVCSLHHCAQIQLDREGFGSLDLPTNRAWGINIERLSITFPHEYDFTDIFNDIKRLNKWRKLVHKVVRKPFTAESPLPADLSIKVQNVMIQLSDDPFEVKLGDNYELLSDESMENQKRFAAMDKRIQDLRKKYGLLQASKIDDLYNSLSRKAAEVYIQRSRQLYVASPCRTKLFTLALSNLEVTALADPSIHGTENVVKHMRAIDKDSPYPEEGMDFVTLWCRMVNVSAESWVISLKDFPMPLLDIQDLHVWGRLIGAEQSPATRARVSMKVDVEKPWGDMSVERSLLPLKFYHDFSCDVAKWNMAYGPCWEPSISQYNLSMNLINRPSIDPSTPLPFWDKARLFMHGRLTMSVTKMRWLYHVSLDPYNTTELMDWTWSNLVLDWTNAKFVLQGHLDIYAKTASKYDDCNLLHLPNLRLSVLLKWLCRGDANDHHSVMPCAPDKVPEYCHQDHDSYRAFRSDNLNMSVSFETKPSKENPDDLPRCLFYGSTLRWMDKIKMCFARVSRPIRRGCYFGVTTKRKPQLSRHIKDGEMSVKLHGFQVQYWVSFARQHGGEMKGGELCLAVGAHLDLVPVEDGLAHRPSANWSVRQFLVQLNSTTVWLLSSSSDGEEGISLRGPVNRNYFLSLEKVDYQRDDATVDTDTTPPSPGQIEERARHRVQIFELKGAWTPSNRNVAFSLYDGYSKAQTLKKNLSSDALKGFKVDSSAGQTPAKNRSMSVTSPTTLCTGVMATPSPASKMGPAFSMLQKLVSEADSRFFAVHEEVSGGNVQVEQLHGIQACQQEDVLHRNWHIELHNSQVMLRGMETTGYVIVSAGKASILSSEHQPIWKDRQPRSKTTWIGTLEFMQYYATVDADPTMAGENILWLTKQNIEHVEDVTDLAGLAGMPEMIGSGQSVGGLVTDHVPKEQGGSGVQLQRIISRCKCQFFYAHFGEADRETYPEVPPPPTSDSDMMKQEEGINSFTLFHHDLNITTNCLQYAMILDLVNNLLLYVEPKKKVANEKLQKMRFQLQLSSGEDQRKPILHQQNTLRKLLSNMRRLERELYMVHKALEDDLQNPELLDQIHELEVRLYDLKTQTTALSAELAIMVSCFKENLLQLKTRKTAKDQKSSAIVRRNEVCFKHAEWRMTEMDGQIGFADLMLRNFLYSKINRSDDSGSHQLELGWVKVTNLLSNTLYKDVLTPQDMGRGHSDRQMSLRILCKFKGPVGGIPVYDHFEVNVVPITIQLTYRFYKTVMGFFFPGRNIDVDDTQSEDGDTSSEASAPPTPAVPPKTRSKKTSIKQKVMQRTNNDDIDKMKERAAQNNMFSFIKIPEVPMRLSYKGSKDKNIEDLYDLSLQLPTLEYHNETWTWLDFLLAVKKDSKRILIQQAIRQKLHVRSRVAPGEEQLKSEGRQAEDKVKMLLGAKLLSGGDKPHSKKSLFGKSNTK